MNPITDQYQNSQLISRSTPPFASRSGLNRDCYHRWSSMHTAVLTRRIEAQLEKKGKVRVSKRRDWPYFPQPG